MFRITGGAFLSTGKLITFLIPISLAYGGYFGRPCALFYFYYSLYCKFNLIYGANKVVVVVKVKLKSMGEKVSKGLALAEKVSKGLEVSFTMCFFPSWVMVSGLYVNS